MSDIETNEQLPTKPRKRKYGKSAKRKRGWKPPHMRNTPAQIDETLTGPIEPPMMDPRLGDLTPAYVEWYGNNHSKQQFNQKYIARRHKIPAELHKYFVH